MSDPQGFAVAAAIVSTLRAASGFRDPSEAGSDVPVYDGPAITGDQPTSFVAVGWTGEKDPQAGTMGAEHVGFGVGGNREETGTVECVAAVVDGSPDFASLRTVAASLIGDVSDALRATPALGLAPVVQWAHITDLNWQQGVSGKGAFVRVNFTVSYLARI